MATLDRRGVAVSSTDPAIVGDPNPDLAWKTPVRVATTAPIALTGLQTIDGVALAAGDRVLVKDQVDQTTNGIYVAASGIWTLAQDANSNDKFTQGLQVMAAQGTVNANTFFALTTTNPIILGTSALAFTADNIPSSAFEFVVDGGGASPIPGTMRTLEIPFNCTITRWTMIADTAGSCVLDVRTCTAAVCNPPTRPSSGDSIAGTDKPTLTAAAFARDSALAGWGNTQLNEGDMIGIAVVSATTLTAVTLSLKLRRR